LTLLRLGALSFTFPKFYQFSLDFTSFLSSIFLKRLNIFEVAILPLAPSSFFVSSFPSLFGAEILILFSNMDFFLRMGGRPVTAPSGSAFSFLYRALETLFESCGGSGPKLSPLQVFASWFGCSFIGYILANVISFFSGTAYFFGSTAGLSIGCTGFSIF
jgi:hypothetical protein